MGIITDIIRGSIGIALLLFICYLLSASRRDIDWKLVAKGIGMQIILALIVLHVPFVRKIFAAIAAFFVQVLEFASAGAVFLFRLHSRRHEFFWFYIRLPGVTHHCFLRCFLVPYYIT